MIDTNIHNASARFWSDFENSPDTTKVFDAIVLHVKDWILYKFFCLTQLTNKSKFNYHSKRIL